MKSFFTITQCLLSLMWFSMWKRHLTHWHVKCVRNVQRLNLKTWNTMETAFNCFWFWVVDFYISNLCQKSQNQHHLTFLWEKTNLWEESFAPNHLALWARKRLNDLAILNIPISRVAKKKNYFKCTGSVNGDDIHHPKSF